MSKEAAMAMLTGDSVPVLATIPTEIPQTPQAPSLQSTPFNHLAKKEAELVRRRDEFKKEQETWAQERTRLEDAKRQYDEYLVAKSTDPVAALKKLGFNEQDIFNYMAGAQPPDLSPEQRAAQAAEQAAETRIRAFEESQTKKEKEAQAEQDKGLINGYRGELNKVISANPDKFEYCAYHGEQANQLAYEIALATVKESKGTDILTAKEAMELAEEYFEEEDKAMNHIKKRGYRPEAVPDPTSKTPERTRTLSNGPVSDAPKPAVQKIRTLSNSTNATVAATRLRMNESKEQKRERLIEALRNGARP